MTAIWVEARIKFKALPGTLCSPLPVPLEDRDRRLVYTNPDVGLPRYLQTCSSVRVRDADSDAEVEFLLAHDSLGRALFLPVHPAHRQIWESCPRMFGEYPYAMPAWIQEWTVASAEYPLTCCDSTITFGPDVLTAAADHGLRTCEEVCAWATGSACKCLQREITEFDPTAQFRCVVLQESCSLCGQAYSLQRRAVRLACGHVFHADMRCSLGHSLRRRAACPLCPDLTAEQPSSDASAHAHAHADPHADAHKELAAASALADWALWAALLEATSLQSYMPEKTRKVPRIKLKI
jgi:hypothetical protein